MSRRKEIDPSYYEENCLADWMEEADRNGDLVRPGNGKNAIEAMREHMLAKKRSETVSLRLPKPLIAAIKRQAASVSVPWTSYMREVLELGVGRIAKRA